MARLPRTSIAALSWLLSSALGLAAASPAAPAAADDNSFAWFDIDPTPDLRYHPCYGTFECARLQVPLDWQDEGNSGRVALAVIRKPATVPEDDPRFGGSIITNPGGPGGSGVAFLPRFSAILNNVINSDERQYEFVSFDPRGVGFTTPRADCFADDTMARDAAMLNARGMGQEYVLGSGLLRRQWAASRAFGTLCNATDSWLDVMRFVSTASVARDMVEMVDRIDELKTKTLREKRTRSERGMSAGDAQRPMGGDEVEVEVVEDKKELPRLQYLGFSYGTILGNTFMSMFPGRVGRLIIDGVDDAYDYVKGWWLCNLHDTEKVMDYFYNECHHAGAKCPLHTDDDKSGADIKKRVDAFISKLDDEPIAMLSVLDGGHHPLIISGNDVRATFIPSLYSPLAGVPIQAKVIADALAGNYTLLNVMVSQIFTPALKDACVLPNPNGTVSAMDPDALAAIACSDADYGTGIAGNLTALAGNAAKLREQSSTLGPTWSGIRFGCAGWPIRPKWRYTGPFTSPPADSSLKEGIPAAPMLLLTSELDPVTPLVNANLMSAGHPGSAVVIQDSVGHCAIATGWSECTNRIVREYLASGKMPKNGTVCHSACRPFDDKPCGPEVGALGLNEHGADRERWPLMPLMV